jgi:DNA repair ATPase RecN
MSDLDPTDQTVDAAIEAAADDAGVGREELLKRAIVALADAEGIDVPDAEEVAAIEARLDDLDAEVDEKVEDLRERFVELYRDLESKAPADHAHEETAERLDGVAADLDALESRLDEVEAEAAATATVGEAVEETIDALDDRLARVESRTGEIDELRDRTEAVDDLEARLTDLEAAVSDLESLDERVGDLDEIEGKLSRVASAVVRVRRRLEAAERDRADRERLDALTAAANRAGVRKAKCTNCGDAVDIGLLTVPECPHCGRRFEELEPSPGFLGTSRLVVGDRPALDGEVGDEGADAGDAPSRGPNAGAGGGVSTRETDGGGEP